MTEKVLKPANVPERESGGLRRLFQRLGSLILRTEQGENETLKHHGQGEAVPVAAREEAPSNATEILRQAFIELRDATATEAGRPEGRSVPALIAGEQVYRDPKVWGPSNPSGPLTVDKNYGIAMDRHRAVLRLAREERENERRSPTQDTSE